MFRKLMLGVLILIGATPVLYASQATCYIEFNTSTYDELERELSSLEQAGARAVHIFPPNAVIAELPTGSHTTLKGNPAVRALYTPDLAQPSFSEARNVLGFAAWRHLLAGEDETQRTLLPADVRLGNCVERFTPMPDSRGGMSPLIDETEMFTSNYLIGRVAVKVILMESNGGSENWQESQINTTVSEIVQALDFLRQQAAYFGANVSWVYEIHQGVPTDYEPIEGPSVPIDLGPPGLGFFWIDDALSFLGFPSQWDGVFDMANAMRSQYRANWAFSVFVVMDENDADHKFSDGKFAYVPWYRNYPTAPDNGCFVVMTYNNDGWTPANMDGVLSHETVHIFRGADEYKEAKEWCHSSACDDPYGYLRVNNGNCEKCNANFVWCIMRGDDVDYYCSYSLGHVGWRDTDGDGACDPIDPNNGDWMSIPNVNLGDLVRIYTVAGDFVNLIAVTADNMATQPANYVIWDGHNYDNQICATDTWYMVTINNGEPFQRRLRSLDPVNPVFTDINYASGNLAWNLDNSFAYVRCFIYDASDNLIARPIWDKLYAAHYLQSLDMDFLPSGQTYTAKFFGWCPDGGKSQTVNYTFTHQCIHCGDADGNGTIDISDPVYIIAHIFSGGLAPGDCRYPKGFGDANGDGVLDISDAVSLISFIFSGSAAPHCQGT